MAVIELIIPDIGDVSDAAVIELLVKPGDTIKAEQSLITIESDKASMEVPSQAGGVLKELRVKLGDTVSEGSLIGLLETAEGEAPATGKAGPAAATVVAPDAPAPTQVAEAAPGAAEGGVEVDGGGKVAASAAAPAATPASPEPATTSAD